MTLTKNEDGSFNLNLSPLELLTLRGISGWNTDVANRVHKKYVELGGLQYSTNNSNGFLKIEAYKSFLGQVWAITNKYYSELGKVNPLFQEEL